MTARITDQTNHRENFTPQALTNFHSDQPPTTPDFNAHYKSMIASNGNGDAMCAIDPPGNGFSLSRSDGKGHSPKAVSERNEVIRADSSLTYRSPESFHPDFSTVGNDQLRTRRFSAEATVTTETTTSMGTESNGKPESIADAKPAKLAIAGQQELALAGDGRRTV